MLNRTLSHSKLSICPSLTAKYPLKSFVLLLVLVIGYRNTSDCIIFIMLFNRLLDKLSKSGSQKRDVKILSNKIFGQHFDVFSKFASAARGFYMLFKLKVWIKYKIFLNLCLIVSWVFALLILIRSTLAIVYYFIL